DFAVTVMGGIRVWVGKGGFSLAKRVVRLSATRPLVKAEVEVMGEGGKSLGKTERALAKTDAEGRYEVFWEQEPGDVKKVVATGFDADGFWARVEVVPFAIFVPHEEVVFAFGS